MKRDVPPTLKRKFRRERRKRVGMTLGIVVAVGLGLSAVARKHYNKALPWHTAWLSHFGNGGWRVAMKSAIRRGDSYEAIERRLGPPTSSEFTVAVGQTRMVYARPGSAATSGESGSDAVLVLYVDRETPVPQEGSTGTPAPAGVGGE